MKTMQIRRAIPSDRGPMLVLWERSARATHGFLNEADFATLRPAVERELASDQLDWWVLSSAGESLAGILAYTENTIEGLFIDPEHRGSGGGRRLVTHAVGLSRGWLSVEVNEDNTEAMAFYRHLGFVDVGRSIDEQAGRPLPLVRMKLGPAPARPFVGD